MFLKEKEGNGEVEKANANDLSSDIRDWLNKFTVKEIKVVNVDCFSFVYFQHALYTIYLVFSGYLQ